MIGYIYKCIYKNKIYIGESIHAKDKNYLGTGKLWLETIKNHKNEVTKEILESIEANDICELKTLMHEREIYWINYYNSNDLSIGYNISPGGNKMSEESKQKMIINDSKAIKHIMETTDCKSKISQSLKQYKKENGVSIEHRNNLHNSLKNRNIGCNGDSRSIQVKCTIDNKEYYFHNKRQAAKWWFENYPISDTFAESTYIRLITKSINKESLSFKGIPIDLNIMWSIDNIEITDFDSIYCIYNNQKYYFENIKKAIYWWHENYPIMQNFGYNIYRDKLIKNIKGFEISRNSIVYDKIQWYKGKENTTLQ